METNIKNMGFNVLNQSNLSSKDEDKASSFSDKLRESVNMIQIAKLMAQSESEIQLCLQGRA